MKRMLIQQGSWLLDRDGNTYDVDMHVPSTTAQTRGVKELVPTDADFLADHGYITENAAILVTKARLYSWAEEQGLDKIGMFEIINFTRDWELKYCDNSLTTAIMGLSGNVDDIITDQEFYNFHRLSDKWYPFLNNNFVKVSYIGKTIEFRISSNDEYDWNKVIFDFVLGLDKPEKYNYIVARESDKGYKSYYNGVTLNELLEDDKKVLSSQEI